MPEDGTVATDRAGSQVPADPCSTLAVFVSHGEGATVITCRGDMDLTTQDTLRACLDDVVRTKPALVVVDVSQVPFFDCGAIGELMRARAALRAFGSTLVLRSPSPLGRRVLSVAGLLDLVAAGSLGELHAVPGPSPSEAATLEVARLTASWKRACEAHPGLAAALVFADPELVVSQVLGALGTPPVPLDPAALAQTLPTAVSRDQPVGTLAASQLLALWRVMQAWIDHGHPGRRRASSKRIWPP